jgi:hypothetical protein
MGKMETLSIIVNSTNQNVHFLARARKPNQKNAPLPRPLRGRLCVAVTAGRAETRPACRQGSDSRRIFFGRVRNARLRGKRENQRPVYKKIKEQFLKNHYLKNSR